MIIVVCYISLFIWSFNYFSTPIIEFEGTKYTIKTETSNELILTSKENDSLRVDIEGKKRVLHYNHEQYLVEQDASTRIYNGFFSNPRTYDVTYPSGNAYQVQAGSSDNMFITYYKADRSLYTEGSALTNENINNQQELQKQLEAIHPKEIVKVVHPSLYDKQGSRGLFILALIISLPFVFILFNKPFQLLLVQLENGWDTPEPKSNSKQVKNLIAISFVAVVIAIAITIYAL